MSEVDGRSRIDHAKRKQWKARQRWKERDKSWQRYARCGVCRKTFCCNNYPDRKARVSHLKMRGVIVCASCRCHPEIEFLVRCMIVVGGLTKVDPPKWVRKHEERRNGSYAGGPR